MFKRRVIKNIFISMACLALFLSATPYKEFGSFSGIGYRSSKIEEDMYRVSFTARSDDTFKRLTDFLFIRCCDIAFENGYKYFMIVEQYYNEEGPDSSGGLSSSFGRNPRSVAARRFNTLTYVIKCFKEDPRQFYAGFNLLHPKAQLAFYEAETAGEEIKKEYGLW